MNEIFQKMLLELAGELIALEDENAEPEAAMAKIRAFRERNAGADVDLVWDRDPYEHHAHYDALLGFEGRGTLSVSFCPDRGLPWPLRGAQRWSEYELVRVNQTLLRVDEAIELIDFVWNEEPLMRRLIDTCLIWETLAREPVEVSDAELQAEMNAFRQAHGLRSAAATVAWMKDHGLDQSRLEHHLEGEVARKKLRARIAAGRVEDYFASRRADFDRAVAVELHAEDHEEALRFSRLSSAQFLERAATSFAAGREPFLRARRSERPELFEIHAPGSILIDGSDRAYLILAIERAELDTRVRGEIEEALFEAWLRTRREKARIEWNWGRTEPAEGEERVRPYR